MKKIKETLLSSPVLYYLFAFMLFLGCRPMGTPDEFRYGQIPKEMLLNGNFIAPTMFGHPYFEKPVMGYWLIALSEWIFGFNAFAIRLPMALCTGLTALMIYLAVKKVSQKSELAKYCVMFYFSSALVVGTAVVCVLDAILSCFTTAMCVTVYFALEERENTLKKMLLLALCGVAAGLAFLTKGPIGWIFPGFAALGYIVWNKRWKELFILPLPILFFCILTVLPWAVAVHKADADFWRYFVVVEHIQRFTTDAGGQHSEPFWYFVPVLLGGVFPGALALAGIFNLPKSAFTGVLENNALRFALCGTILPFLFLSCSNGKLLTYLLPSFPCIAVLFGTLFARQTENEKSVKTLEKLSQTVIVIYGIAGVAGCVAALFIVPQVFHRMVFTGGILFFASYIICKRYSRQSIVKQLDALIVTLALTTAGTLANLPSEINNSKFPEKSILAVKNALPSMKNIRIATNTGYMHPMVWVFDTCDFILIGRKGEHDYAIDRYTKEGKKSFYFPYSKINDAISQAEKDKKTLVVFYETKRKERFRSEKYTPDKSIELPEFTGDIYFLHNSK